MSPAIRQGLVEVAVYGTIAAAIVGLFWIAYGEWHNAWFFILAAPGLGVARTVWREHLRRKSASGQP